MPLGLSKAAEVTPDDGLAPIAQPVRLLLLPGDGIGPEIMDVVSRCLDGLGEAHGLELRLERRQVGLELWRHTRQTMPDDLAALVEANDGIVMGPLSTSEYPPRAEGGVNVSAHLRRSLDLFANIRPVRADASLSRVGIAFDLEIVRENSEGMLADRVMHVGNGEFMPTPEVALAVRKITVPGCRRIAEVACRRALARRGHLTVVHKANALPITDGLFLDIVREVAAAHPEIEVREVLVDAMAALLVRDPSQFDVVVTTNLFGDILSDEAGELSGSIGLAPSLNAGRDRAMAQAVHGSGSEIANQDKANPTALLLSVAMLLEWLADRRGDADLHCAGRALHHAIRTTLSDPRCRTADVGGSLGTRAFGEAVAERLRRDARVNTG
ncbi:MAG: isocitrate/isopropylmalate dehydrogenase family protein [Thermoanaerobaculia bacterium]